MSFVREDPILTRSRTAQLSETNTIITRSRAARLKNPKRNDTTAWDRRNTQLEKQTNKRVRANDTTTRGVRQKNERCYGDTIPDASALFFHFADDATPISPDRCNGCVYFGHGFDGLKRFRRCTLKHTVNDDKFCRTHIGTQIFLQYWSTLHDCSKHGPQITAEVFREEAVRNVNCHKQFFVECRHEMLKLKEERTNQQVTYAAQTRDYALRLEQYTLELRESESIVQTQRTELEKLTAIRDQNETDRKSASESLTRLTAEYMKCTAQLKTCQDAQKVAAQEAVAKAKAAAEVQGAPEKQITDSDDEGVSIQTRSGTDAPSPKRGRGRTPDRKQRDAQSVSPLREDPPIQNQRRRRSKPALIYNGE